MRISDWSSDVCSSDLRGLHALGHHVHLADDLVDLAAPAELLADVAVAALRRDAGGDEVAHAREPGEGDLAAAHGAAEPGELGQAAGDDGGPRVVAGAEAVSHARGDGHEIGRAHV